MILDGMLYFTENVGQVEERCEFYISSPDINVLFFHDRVIFLLRSSNGTERVTLPLDIRTMDSYEEQGEIFLEAKDKKEFSINYMVGPQKEWLRNIPVYERLCYHNVCDGIDIEFYLEDNRLKQDFIIYPGAKIEDLRLEFKGQKSIQKNHPGEIKLVGTHKSFTLRTHYNFLSNAASQ